MAKQKEMIKIKRVLVYVREKKKNDKTFQSPLRNKSLRIPFGFFLSSASEIINQRSKARSVKSANDIKFNFVITFSCSKRISQEFALPTFFALFYLMGQLFLFAKHTRSN